MVNNSKATFKWIVTILKKNKIPFQITGGLAARQYGSDRPLYDIDIDMPNEFFEKLLPFVSDFVTFGPGEHVNNHFNITMMTIKYNDCQIDISGTEDGKFYNECEDKWETYGKDFEYSKLLNIFGETVPVIEKQKLIEFKKKLGRPTDLEDVASLSKS